MKRSVIMPLSLALFVFTGCSSTTITKKVFDDEPTYKRVETSDTFVQNGPNIYKNGEKKNPCPNNSCVPMYDVTQDKCTDYPVSYRAKRQLVEKDVVIIKE